MWSQSHYRQVHHRPGFGHGFKPWMPFVFGWLFLSFMFWGGFKLLGFLIPLLFVAWIVNGIFRANKWQQHRWYPSDHGGWQGYYEKQKRKNDWTDADNETPTYEAKRKRGEDGNDIYYV